MTPPTTLICLQQMKKIPSTKNHLGHEDQTINTRCTASRWCRIVKKLSEEQKVVVRVLGFGNLLVLNCGRLRLKICRWFVDNFDAKACSIDIHGWRFVINSSVFARVSGISDQGDQISIYEDVPNKDFWKSKIAMTSRGIVLKDIKHYLEEMTTADDKFKVTLYLFLLGTIISPSATDYVHTGYLIPLRDVGSICTKNWSSWCFSSLCEGIEKFQINRQRMKTCCIFGCVLFFQLFYLHSLQWEPPIVDKAISVEDFFKQPTPLEGQYDVIAHGETCHANQEPVTGNNAHMKDGKQYSLKKSLSKLWESYMYDLRRCEKSFDIVVAFPTTFSFTTFTILDAKAPSQPNGYDCGLLLCMFVGDKCPTPLQMESFQSQCQHLLLAHFLALFPDNSNILSLKKNVQEHYNKIVSNNEVVPTVKMRAPPI
ncbi:hypothetical protein EZV62_002091 [Acer yangbiense]|uniref:Ubiquitin-like protease family profile domain-containing protein n=1 Tax=Acer yangbiense TaxID=1000413 RepID=A0A5C7IY34_9ROSI|nr:hypothetical protein EZV62_002091 [Acer yangbiense]